MKVMWFAGLSMIAGIDLWKREIPGVWFVMFGALGLGGRILIFFYGSDNIQTMGGMTTIISMGLGVGLLLVSYGTRGAVGDGDGWFFLISGLYLSWQENLCLLWYGLLLSNCYGLYLMLWGQKNGISIRKKKIPFLPFLLPVGIWMVFL